MSSHDSAPQKPTEAQITQTLEVILASRPFARAERTRQLLAYLVEQTVAGKGAQIKGYSIGIAVFDREDDFDPQNDNIVRINGGRLRQKLTDFYQSEQAEAARVVIELPKRSYNPQFTYNPSYIAEITDQAETSVESVSELSE